MGVDKIKKLEGLGTKGMCIRLVLLPRSVGTAKLFMDRQVGNPEGALCGEGDRLEAPVHPNAVREDWNDGR